MAYRNPLAWDRNLRPGLFKPCSQDEPLPRPDLGIRFDINGSSFAGFDWLGEENNTSFTYTDAELDRMVAELDILGYGDSFGSGAGAADCLSIDMPGRSSVDIRIMRSHYH